VHCAVGLPGTLGNNVPEMVNMFVNGRTFASVKETDAVARMTVAFGRVSGFVSSAYYITTDHVMGLAHRSLWLQVCLSCMGT